jgi:hypothetical protein
LSVKRRHSLQPLAAGVALVVCGVCVPLARAQEQTEPPLDASEVSDASAPAPAQPQPSAGMTPMASLLAGGGVTSRTIHVPATDGSRSLVTGLVPALAVRIYGRLQDASRFLGVRLSYQTSIGVSAAQTVPDLSLIASETHIRSHRFEGGLVPGLFLGHSDDSPALSLFVGYGLRALGSIAEIRIPRFTLHGPLARLEFELPLLAGRVSLRLAPELQLIAGMTQQLRASAGLGSTALAFGGEASVRVQVSGPFAARLCYREAHARAAALAGQVFEDIERYLTLELSYRYE